MFYNIIQLETMVRVVVASWQRWLTSIAFFSTMQIVCIWQVAGIVTVASLHMYRMITVMPMCVQV